MPINNNPTVEELVAEGVPQNVAALIQPFLNRWASEVGDLSRALRSTLSSVSPASIRIASPSPNNNQENTT